MCARMAGVQESVLQRAQAIKDAISNKQVIRPVHQKSDPLHRHITRKVLRLFFSVKKWVASSSGRLVDTSHHAPDEVNLTDLSKFKDLLLQL